jgi:glycosidase
MPSIELNGTDADVWAWEKEITGVCHCGHEGGTITVAVNGRHVRARRRGRRFRARVRLDEGKNYVIARCTSGGREHVSNELILTQRLRSRPAARIDVSITRDGIVLGGSASRPAEGSGAPIAEYTWRPHPGNPAPLSDVYGRGRLRGPQATYAVPKKDGEYRVSLRVTDAEGRTDRATTYFVVRDGTARAVDMSTENPAWVDRAVVYGVVPHNFGPKGFCSVVERLDSLQDLGVDVLWMSPFNTTKSGGHGYGVDDYFRVRRDYGTKRDLRRLVQEAHSRGLRVIMDFVANHTSLHHRYMRDVRARGAASPYREFYERGESDTDHSFYFSWTRLANLNYHNPEVQRWILEAFSHWVRDVDIDGFRVDAAWGVQLRQSDFWSKWRRELKRIKPDLLLLAEASARDSYWFTDGFDAAYDWTDDLGCWSMAEVFEEPTEIVPRLHAALTNEGRGLHEDALIFRFLNNNDTGSRFITRYGVGMERVAAAMLLTLPGLPCIYTGQEVRAEFEPYRTPGPILPTRSREQTYAYARYDAAGRRPVLVVLNFSRQTTSVTVELTQRACAFQRMSRGLDLLSGQEVATESRSARDVALKVPGQTGLLIVPA